jgi:NodT family efflux transporter outer membrane factor (OMF) lipoprotein
MKRLLPPAALLLAPLLLESACTVGPDYRPPEAAPPAAFAGPQAAAPVGTIPADWWSLFGDPALDDLVARALKDSPDIATAASRVRQARLQEVIAGAAGKPTVNASAGASRIEFSKNAGFATLAQQFSGGAGGGGTGGEGAPNGLGLPGTGISTFSLGFDAAWELDLFGGARRGRQAATARREAAEFGAQDAALTLSAEVASAYFQLRLAEVQLATLEEELTRQRRTNQIAANISKAGLVPQNDVVRGRGSISSTEARAEPLRAEIATQRNALAVLLGQPPEGFAVPAATPAADVPAIPAGLPADLIRRRPDVRAAERQLAAATADIGVAVADLYPKFQLTGVAQLISTALRTLFEGDSVQLTASGQATFPLLDWGRRKSTVKLREEDRAQAYNAWRSAVLGALREVEDALARLDAERRRNATLAGAVTDRATSVRAVEAQYRTGFVAQDQLLGAEIDLLAAREQKAQSDDTLRRQTVALVKALGGGWTP